MPNQIQTDPSNPRFLKYPYSVSGSGIPNTTLADDHLRDLILQVLFTSPGERVNLPEFGVGVQRLVFEPSSDTLRSRPSAATCARSRSRSGPSPTIR